MRSIHRSSWLQSEGSAQPFMGSVCSSPFRMSDPPATAPLCQIMSQRVKRTRGKSQSTPWLIAANSCTSRLQIYEKYGVTCTFRVSRHDSHKKVVAKVENVKGVMNTKWNPRTREVTVIYDAKVTSARHIKHFMA